MGRSFRTTLGAFFNRRHCALADASAKEKPTKFSECRGNLRLKIEVSMLTMGSGDLQDQVRKSYYNDHNEQVEETWVIMWASLLSWIRMRVVKR